MIIQWGRVPCMTRNSNITGYMVRYSTGGGITVNVSVSGTDQSDRTYTASWLAPNTSYSIQVAAVTSTGATGPFSTTITEEMLRPKSEASYRKIGTVPIFEISSQNGCLLSWAANKCM